ncbi:hypothetical protein IF2G_02753 [Cordyceps javanica]|nr:hypothetical protein IF2G_02753 [Cordyceps javanica]
MVLITCAKPKSDAKKAHPLSSCRPRRSSLFCFACLIQNCRVNGWVMDGDGQTILRSLPLVSGCIVSFHFTRGKRKKSMKDSMQLFNSCKKNIHQP